MAIETGADRPMIELTLPDAEGGSHDLATELTGPVVVGIYKSSCQASKTMFPYLERIARQYAAAGVRVLGVSQDSDNITRSFAKRLGVTFPIVIEGADYPVTRAFDIQATPTVFVIDGDGRIAYSTMGFFQQQIEEVAAAAATAAGTPVVPILIEADQDAPKFVPG